MKKLSLSFSDIELGSGNKTDDFVEDDLLCETIRNNFHEQDKYPVDLVLNGDIFDFMKCPYKGEHPRHITEKVSIGKLQSMAKAHPKVFKVWKEWLERSKKSRIIFVLGNHDYDIIFPEVQEEIKNLIAGKNKKIRNRIVFPGVEFNDGVVTFHHGSQFDQVFRIDEKKLIHYKKDLIGEPYLLHPWGHNALYEYFINYKKAFYLLERIFPRQKAMMLLPQKYYRRAFTGTILYLLKTFFYTQIRHWNDNLYRLGPAELYFYIVSMFKKEFDLIIMDNARRHLRRSDYKILVIGHNHKRGIHEVKNDRIINTNAWRDEFFFYKKDGKFHPKNKSYAYILHSPERIHEVRLIDVESHQKPLTVKDIENSMKDVKLIKKLVG